jgi:hypothetical protein
MQSFIVLGIVPGTNYQVNFMFWVYVVLGLFVAMPLISRVARKRHIVRARLAARKIEDYLSHQLQTA